MKKVITLSEIYAGKLPKLSEGFIEGFDTLLKKRQSADDPKTAIQLNVSTIDEFIERHLSEFDLRFTGQDIMNAIILHYATTMKVWHDRNVVFFGPHFQNTGKYELRSSVRRSTAPASRPCISDEILDEE